MHLYYAQTIAEIIKSRLEPYCEVINIAGSIRRKNPDVKDIELVLIPKTFIQKETNLFQEVIRETKVIHPEFEKEVRQTGTIEKGKFGGRYMKLIVKQQIQGIEYSLALDMFTPQPSDYYRQLAIRTGSADYAYRFIASIWKKRGWVGINGDLFLMKECHQVEENKWVLKKEVLEPTRPPVWQSEQEFFKWLGVQYLSPEQRNL